METNDVTISPGDTTPFDRLAHEMSVGFALLETVADATGSPTGFVIRSVNPAFERHTGLSAAAVTGHPLAQVLPSSQPTWFPHLFSAATTDNATRFEFHDKGTNRHLDVTAFRLDTRHIAMTCMDISERRMAETDMLNALRIDAIGILAGGIAHDFNNLLMLIAGNVSLALSCVEGKDKDTAEFLREAKAAADRAKELVRQFATFSRQGAPLREAASIARIVRDSATFCTRGSNTQCEFNLPRDLWAGHVDTIQVSQVVQNIVLNAVQAMPGGGTITVRAENLLVGPDSKLPLNPDWYVKLTITDTGPGIAPENLPQIFTPYFTTKKTGSGLGLAICHSIVRRHNGHITASSRLGAGASFEVYLPALMQVPNDQPTRTPVVSRGSGRILVMDDEAAMHHLIARILARLGFEVTRSAHGVEAVNLYRLGMESGRPFAAVILDLMIPGGLNGKEALDQIRELDPTVKAVVCSGLTDNPVVTNYREYGFAAALTKPFDMNDMAEVLNRLLAVPVRPTSRVDPRDA